MATRRLLCAIPRKPSRRNRWPRRRHVVAGLAFADIVLVSIACVASQYTLAFSLIGCLGLLAWTDVRALARQERTPPPVPLED